MKMLNKILISSAVTLLLTACSDFFDMERQPQLPVNTVEDLELCAVSPYNKVFYGGWGAFQSNHMLNEVLQTDYFKWIGNVEDYPTEDIYNRRYNQRIPQIDELWGKLYAAIGVCNSGLYFYDQTNGEPIPYTSAEDQKLNVDRIKGELLFMRAYSYYYLTSIFCPPYGYGKDDEKILVKRDHMVEGSDDALGNDPVPTSEIFQLMVDDLTEAIELLPTDWQDGMHESYKSRGRANRWAAKALLAQVYFTMQEWDKALELYDDIIDNGGYDLEKNPFTNFNNQSTLPLSSENKEVIMWIFQADGDMNPTRHNSNRFCHFNKCKLDAQLGGNGNSSTGRTISWSFHDWLQMCIAPSALKQMGWMAADGSETTEARCDLRYYNHTNESSFVNKEGLYYRFEGCDLAKTGGKRTNASADGKYITNPKYSAFIGTDEPVVFLNKYYRTEKGRLQNVPLFRLAEILLNRAAVKQKLNNPGWADDFNRVARRAWNATATGAAYADKSDAEVTQEVIRIERWKEMAGEDSWYSRYCAALGLTMTAADRTDTGSDYAVLSTDNYAESYWKNCIPLSGELDFR